MHPRLGRSCKLGTETQAVRIPVHSTIKTNTIRARNTVGCSPPIQSVAAPSPGGKEIKLLRRQRVPDCGLASQASSSPLTPSGRESLGPRSSCVEEDLSPILYIRLASDPESPSHLFTLSQFIEIPFFGHSTPRAVTPGDLLWASYSRLPTSTSAPNLSLFRLHDEAPSTPKAMWSAGLQLWLLQGSQ
ncbi:hypothetical protein CC2G_004714 [Coprinopsis cinerea AmutBmut pab1-1]|nr:hypothetical protein CC2G_004714 [Coprinopsis cinerea AmutBmut pab1-1]